MKHSTRGRRSAWAARLALAGCVAGCSGDGLKEGVLAEALWTPTAGLLNDARRSHGAAVLPWGQALVTGGTGACGCAPAPALTSTELFDPASGRWAYTGAMAVGRQQDMTATELSSGRVLAVGGETITSTADTYFASAEQYDPDAGTWSSAGSMAVARARHTATRLADGRVLVVGGVNTHNSNWLNSAELYEPGTNQWVQTGSMGTARDAHTATLLPSGKVLVAGGGNSTTTLRSAELYDPDAGTWSPANSMAGARWGHTATLLTTGKVLVAGGTTTGGIGLSTTEVYDPGNGGWTGTNPMTYPRLAHTATLLPSGQVLVAGGYTNTGEVAAAETYDPTSGNWTPAGSLSTARHGHTATLVPGGVVIAGGYDGTDSTAISEEYTGWPTPADAGIADGSPPPGPDAASPPDASTIGPGSDGSAVDGSSQPVDAGGRRPSLIGVSCGCGATSQAGGTAAATLVFLFRRRRRAQ